MWHLHTLFLPKHSLPRELNYLIQEYTQYVSDLDIWKHIRISGRGGGKLSKDPNSDQWNENFWALSQAQQGNVRHSRRWLETHPSLSLSSIHSFWVILYFSSFLQGPFRNLSLRGILFSLFCSLSPKPPGQFRSGCMANERFTAASSVGAEFILKASCIPPVKTNIPSEVSLWLNFSVSNRQTQALFLSFPFSPQHMHTQYGYQFSKF